MKLKINNKNTTKFTNTWKFNTLPGYTPGSRKKSKWKIKTIMRQQKWEYNIPKLTGCSKSSFRSL